MRAIIVLGSRDMMVLAEDWRLPRLEICSEVAAVWHRELRKQWLAKCWRRAPIGARTLWTDTLEW